MDRAWMCSRSRSRRSMRDIDARWVRSTPLPTHMGIDVSFQAQLGRRDDSPTPLRFVGELIIVIIHATTCGCPIWDFLCVPA
eukprot:1452321-Prymnesium_polylepis.1